jgi:DNA-directed RNA polymerase specialized sigma24 family protein
MNALDRLHDESHVRQHRPSEWRRMLAEAGFVVHEVEPYVQHRPLTTLTDGVSPENVARIRDMLASLDETQRTALNLADVDGQPYLNHWYVLIAATTG